MQQQKNLLQSFVGFQKKKTAEMKSTSTFILFKSFNLCQLIIFSILIFASLFHCCNSQLIPLDNYVRKAEDVYNYKVITTITLPIAKVHVLNMTSLTWLNQNEFQSPSSSIWHHVLITIIPNEIINPNISLLFVDGGNVDTIGNYLSNLNLQNLILSVQQLPPFLLSLMQAALNTKTITSLLYLIPNQPLVFTKDPSGKRRVEDEILAFSFKQFLLAGKNGGNNNSSKTGDDFGEEWLALFPMVKATVLAMDTIQNFTTLKQQQQQVEQKGRIEKFVLSGASKRGWTVWLTAAVDPYNRVQAIIPIVFPFLNMELSSLSMMKSLCGYPSALGPYVNEGIQNYIVGNINATTDDDSSTSKGLQQFSNLTALIDPLSYKERFENIIKYMINSLGDQFFWPDIANFSYDLLPGEKFIRFIPNTDHGLEGSDVIDSVQHFYQAVVTLNANNQNQEQPQLQLADMLPIYHFNYSYVDNGAIAYTTITNNKVPTSVTLWKASNSNLRDFRKQTIGANWKALTLQTNNNNTTIKDSNDGSEVSLVSKTTELIIYKVFVPNPSVGWTAFTVELDFAQLPISQSLSIPSQKFTTTTFVTPNTYPNCSTSNHTQSTSP